MGFRFEIPVSWSAGRSGIGKTRARRRLAVQWQDLFGTLLFAGLALAPGA